MTYKELLEELQSASEEQLNQNVTVHLMDDDEYYPIHSVCVAVDPRLLERHRRRRGYGHGREWCGVLDEDHLVLAAGI